MMNVHNAVLPMDKDAFGLSRVQLKVIIIIYYKIVHELYKIINKNNKMLSYKIVMN